MPQNFVMRLKNYRKGKTDMGLWYKNSDKENPLVVSSRIRLARNVANLPFPTRMNDSQKQELLNSVKNILDGINIEGVGTLKYFNLESIPEEELYAMVERHTISPDFAKKSGPKGLIISEDESVSIMLLEEDHIRIQVLVGGFALETAYDTALAIENILDRNLKIAFDSQLGYLTECPTNLGTGLRASTMLHLPVLESLGAVSHLADSVAKIGLTIRGMYGEGSASKAALYQLSNQVTLGISEKSAIENLKAITGQIVAREQNSLAEIDKSVLEDTVYRAFGTLKYARKLSGEEMMNLISQVKLGVDAGILKISDISLPMTLLIETAPATLQKKHGKMSPEDRDVVRAKEIRERLE